MLRGLADSQREKDPSSPTETAQSSFIFVKRHAREQEEGADT